MKEYDFDEIIDRAGTGSLKHNFKEAFGYAPEVLPLWVADMDFRTAPPITEALIRRAEHGIFGYTLPDGEYTEALNRWFAPRFGRRIAADWIVKVPGVVFGIAQAIQALTCPGDGILIQEPVYYPFRKTIEANGRTLKVNELIEIEGEYAMDFEDLEKQLASGEVRLLILCSPHNPVGRVWRADELNRLGNLCLRYEVPVIADEIHMDFTYGEHRHHMFASLNPAFAEISITCTAPSKTFNLAGLQLSNLIIPNEPLRQAVEQNLLRTGYDEPNTFGLTACVAAYRAGDAWLQAVRTYIYENYLYLKNCFVRRNLPVRVCELQGTYLAWVDFRPTGLAPEVITRKIVQEAGLWLDAGEMFGRSGAGFQRINLACPRRILEQAVERLCPLFGS